MPEPSTYTILIVDDEIAILRSLQRLFRKTGGRILSAGGGKEALEMLSSTDRESLALIISDQRMPEMNGAQFLEKAKVLAPDAVRFLLTGYSELEALADSINKGEIHRYITKPWDDEELLTLVRQAVEQFQLKAENKRLTALTRQQNKELAEFNKRLEAKVRERTRALEEKKKEIEAGLFNSIRAFTSLLNMHTPNLGEHGRRVSFVSGRIAEEMKLPNDQVTRIEIAGLLHDIGKLGFSERLLSYDFATWNEKEKKQYAAHSIQGQHVIQFVNQLGSVSLVIRSHHERFDGQGFPDGLSETQIPLGARIIAVANAYDKMVHLNVDTEYLIKNYLSSLRERKELPRKELMEKAALHHLKQKAFTRYDPDIVKILLNIFEKKKLEMTYNRSVSIRELKAGMVLGKELYSVKGHFLLSKSTTITDEHIPKLMALFDLRLIEDNISIQSKEP